MSEKQYLTLKKLSPEQRIQLAKNNLAYFPRYMGYEDTGWFHDEWYELLQPQNNPAHFSPLPWHPKALKKYHLEAPRKHAKSECIAINYVSWLIGNYPDIRILIVSKTGDLAEATVAAIKTRIESDPKYQNIFGNLKPDSPQKWTDSQFIVKRKRISKFPTLKGCGLGGALTGGGNDLILADDIIDEENVRTPLQLEKADTWFFKVLLTTLFAHGGTFALGTRWHYADLYTKLLKEWPCKIYKAILNEQEIAQGKPPKVLWPEVWSYERLQDKLKDIGTIFFNCQYQNDPTSMEGDLLKSEWLNSWEQPPLHNNIKYAGIDPALGEGDLQSIATLSTDLGTHQAYLEDVYADRLPFPSFLQKIQQLHSLHKYSKIFIESNAFQKVLMYVPELRGLPIVPSPTVRDKEQRFISMSSHFEAKRVLVNPLLQRRSEFWTEWVQFPRGAHDDALDAVEIVTRNVIGAPRASITFLR